MRSSRPRRSVTGTAAFLAILVVGAVAGARLGDAPPPPPAVATGPSARFAVDIDVTAFDKGNLHTHSIESDGDASPEDVYRFYRDHGYQFVAITDHNHLVDPKTYAWLERPRFKIVPGEEITMQAEGKEVHVNALCLSTKIPGGAFDTKKAALEHAIYGAAAQGAIALINHPNFGAALDLGDLLDGGRHATLLEIWSGHPYVYSAGDGDRPSHETLWEASLSRGVPFVGVAVDDMHALHAPSRSEKSAAPLRGWIETYAVPGAPVELATLCEHIRRGELYASNGPSIERIRVAGRSFEIWPTDASAEITFLGTGGRVLEHRHADETGRVSYELDESEPWVRARVETPDGKHAWTQAFRAAR